MNMQDTHSCHGARRRELVLSALAALATAAAVSPVAAQHEHHDHHAQHAKDAAKPVAPQRATFTLTETPLLDQDARKLKFKSEALGERIAVVSFIYTTCTTVCPVVSAVMAQLQGKLGARLGKDVALVTVTVDPVRDTPPRLKAYGASLGAGAGWTWLTGPKPQVDEVLKVFGAYTPNFVEHPALIVVGDAKSGKWLRFFGFPTPEQLMAAVDELSAGRAKPGSAG
jgi:protein SCO1